MPGPRSNAGQVAAALVLAVLLGAPARPVLAQLAGTPGGQKVDGRLAGPDRQSATDIAIEARESFLSEDFKEAEISARLALRADPENPLANAVLGNVLAVLGALDDDTGKVAQAREHVARALARDPKLALGHNALGVVLAAEGKITEAENAFTKAIELDDGLAVAYGNLAWVDWQRKRFDQAERGYRRAIKLDPERAVPYNGLATVLGSLSRYEEMEAACRNAIRRYQARDRILASLYVNLAVALHEEGHHEAALHAVTRARALGLPHHPAYRVIQGGAVSIPE